MKTVVIVQARLGSTRLPAKVLLPLPTGRTVLEEVLTRCRKIKGVHEVCLACPAEDAPILARFSLFGSAMPICFPAIDQNDVLGRYAFAAEAFSADIIMRITADCPMLDPKVCAEVLALRNEADFDYVSNAWPDRTFPHGFDCEVFKAWALRSAVENADVYGVTAEDREHVGPAIRKVVGNVEMACLRAPVDRSSERVTLDTIEDYRHIWKLLNDSRSDTLAA